MKSIFVYVLEFMLTVDKMQNISTLMCKNFEILGQSILKVIQAFHTVHIYIGCSGSVNILILLYPLFCLEKKSILISCQSRSVVRSFVRASVRHFSCKCISS